MYCSCRGCRNANNKTKYVVGFAFDENGRNVLLIRKNRPDWQRGKLNGIGGHIEPEDDSAHKAMEREFLEEANLYVLSQDWDLFVIQEMENAIIYKFRCFNVPITSARKMTDEELFIVNVTRPAWPQAYKTIENLNWCVQLALDDTIKFSTVEGV